MKGIYKRIKKSIVCQICNKSFSNVGIAMHFKSVHGITTDQYSQIYGEFRVNKLSGGKLQSSEVCLICNDQNIFTPHGLTWHLKKEHSMKKLDYIKQYILKNVTPTCECGCGEILPIKTFYPYITRKFKSGHNSRGDNNPRYGKSFSSSTREKMRLKALHRIKNYVGDTLPMHRPEAIKKRAELQTKKHIEKCQLEYNVTIQDILEEYDIKQYTYECNVCKTVFSQYHSSYFICPKCNPRIRSLMETQVMDTINNIDNSIKIIQNSRSILSNNKELDITLPDFKLAIEFDGLYWHSELNGKNKQYHLEKTEECEKLGYKLIHIFEDEWVLHKDIIIGKLAGLLKKDSRKRIFARKCQIKNLTHNETKDFLNTHHLQGADSSKHRYGLVYDGQLVEVMTFSKPNASRGNYKQDIGTYELSRLCTDSNYICIGGASKLLKHFIKEINPKKIYSYADRRYSNIFSNVYGELGFSLVSKTPPSYWYFTYREGKRYHRFNFTKKKTVQMGGSPDKTEWENMITLGYDRIWDCGHLKYELTI